MVGKNNKHLNLKNINLTVKQKIALILGFSIFLTVAAGLVAKMKDTSVISVSRPAPGATKEVELDAYEAGSDEPVHLNLKINPKSYSKEDAKVILEETKDKLEELIKADNESLSNVRGRLNLADTFTEYGVSAEWMSSDFETVGFDGEVYNSDFDDDEKREVTLFAKLRLGESEVQKSIDVTVSAPVLNKEEADKERLIRAVNVAQEEAAQEDAFTLPTNIDGTDVTYTLPESGTAPAFFLLLGMLGAVCVVVGEKKKKERMQKERADELLGDYAGITSKLSLFFGAGMTVFKSCEKVLAGYAVEKEKRPGFRKEAYECLQDSMNLIGNGASEPEGYTRFGEKCGIREYKKLGAYLSDHVRKGTGDLDRLLRDETRESFLTRKALVKSKAQEAGTRMLFPMVLMLGVVMAIVFIPSMMSFSI